MPPTHPNNNDVAAAYRTLIAHETSPKEQDFYRARLERLTSPTAADTGLVERLAGIAWEASQQAAYDKSHDSDENPPVHIEWAGRTDDDREFTRAGIRALLADLAASGRLVPEGGQILDGLIDCQEGQILTVERLAELIADAPAANYEEDDYNAGYVAALIDLRDSLFSATEPAEAPCTHPGQWCPCEDKWHAAQAKKKEAPAVPAEEETKAEGYCTCHPETQGQTADCGMRAHRVPASSPVVPAPTETGPFSSLDRVPDSVDHIIDRNGIRLDRLIPGQAPKAGYRWTYRTGPDAGKLALWSDAPFVAAEEKDA